MKKIIALIACLTMLCLLTFAASADTFNGTMVRYDNADPQLFFYNGKYYLTQTGTSRIAVFETEHVDKLKDLTLTANIEYTGYLNGTVYDPAIEELFGAGATINGTWSPEIHYIDEDMFGEDYAGWYMFLGLRQNTGDSSMVRLVVLKSTTDSPKGPYGHPTKGTVNYSQPLLNSDGSIHDEWACGQTLLTIPEGPYKGTYTMWVSEEGRGSANGGKYGEFYQKIMIAKMKSPWQIDGTPGIVTTPTQQWEYAGASTTHPRVVEGATPVYGKNGEIFITYSGSGYWSDYGLGQLTWNGGNPLETSSWVKLPVEYGNPIFTATTAENLRGAGHASFLTDTDGNGYFCYHAYGYNYEYNKDTKKWQSASGKESKRAAYIEPYYIDYTAWNGVSYGVVRLGLNENGVAADMLDSVVTFATDGSYLTSPDLYALGRTFSITLNMFEANAEDFIIYRSTDGEVFDYLATTVGSQYVDENVTEGETYYYRAYAYREEEISPVSETVSQKATTLSSNQISAAADGATVTITVIAEDNYDAMRLYRSDDGESYGTGIQDIKNVKYGETVTFTDTVSANGTYRYMVSGINGEFEYLPARTVSVEVTGIIAAPEIDTHINKGSLFVFVDYREEFDSAIIYRSTDGVDFKEFATFSEEVPGILGIADTDVVYGNTYYYYAVGYVDGNKSLPSEVLAYTVRFLPAPNLNSVSYNCSRIIVGWETPNEGDVHIYRSVNEGEYTFLTVGNGTEYTDTDIIIGNSYNYKLKLVNEDLGLESDLSMQWKSVTPQHKEGLTEFPALEPTCTEDGYTAYHTCRYCDTVTSGKEVIPASGHSYELTEEEIPATTESAGKTAVYTCPSCGDSYGGEEIPKLESPEEVTLAGDASGDGVVNTLDVLRVLKAVIGMDVEVSTANADMNSDGTLDIADVLAILTLILNK